MIDVLDKPAGRTLRTWSTPRQDRPVLRGALVESESDVSSLLWVGPRTSKRMALAHVMPVHGRTVGDERRSGAGRCACSYFCGTLGGEHRSCVRAVGEERPQQMQRSMCVQEHFMHVAACHIPQTMSHLHVQDTHRILSHHSNLISASHHSSRSNLPYPVSFPSSLTLLVSTPAETIAHRFIPRILPLHPLQCKTVRRLLLVSRQ